MTVKLLIEYHLEFLSLNEAVQARMSLRLKKNLAEERAGCSTSLYYCCSVPVSVLFLFFSMPWVGLWYVIVALPGPYHLTKVCKTATRLRQENMQNGD